MEKRTPHYKLAEIQAQMVSIETLRLTASSRTGLAALGWRFHDALEVVKNLTKKDFFKSMTTYKDAKVWQDVYRPTYKGIELYVKFQMDEQGYFTISFKEV